MSRETLIKATVTTSLGFDANVEAETAVDRIIAIACASRQNELGATILHAEGLDAPSLRKAVLIVARRLNRKCKITLDIGQCIALASLKELLNPHCPDCGGMAFHYHDGQVVKVCSTCNGSGLHRYTDTERANMAGLSKIPIKVYELAIADARDALANAVRLADSRLTR